MKYTILLLILLFPVFADAQTQSLKDSVYRDSLVKSVLNDLKETWNLGIDNASGTVDLRIYNKFKSLFEPTATVNDDFNAYYKFNFYWDTIKGKPVYHINGSYKFDDTAKAYDVYAHDIALQVRKLTIDTGLVKVISAIFSPDSNQVTLTIKRIAKAEKTREYILDTGYVTDLFKSRPHINFAASGLTAEHIKQKLETLLQASKDTVYKFIADDILVVKMVYHDRWMTDYDTISTYRINSISIKNQNDTIVCTNDKDNDAITNAEEKDSTLVSRGDFTAGGLPDYDLDGVADDGKDKDACPEIYGDSSINHGCPIGDYFARNFQWDAFVGLQMNDAKINLPELNQLGYIDESGNDAMDVLQSKKGVLKNPGTAAGINIGADFSYFFGKTKRRSGISIGLSYSRFKADYELTSPVMYTFKSFDGTDFYRRQITIDSLKEVITYSIFNFPVMFNYRMYLDNQNKSSINIKLGPSLMLLSANSNYNAQVSFGGLYQTDGENVVYTDLFDNGSTYNFFITADSINAQNPNPGADAVFNKLKENSANYDFADNKHYEGKQKNSLRATIAFNLAIDLQKQIGKNWGLQFGAHFIYANLPERSEKYKPIDKTTDQFNSIYNSTAKTHYSAYGLNLGFVYNF